MEEKREEYPGRKTDRKKEQRDEREFVSGRSRGALKLELLEPNMDSRRLERESRL